MKGLTIALASLTLLLLFCVLVCGLWIGANGTDAAGIDFHRTIGVAAVVSSAAVCVLALVIAGKKRAGASAK